MVGASTLRYVSRGLIVAAILATTAAFGADADNGQRLAHRWCEACHVVVVFTNPAPHDHQTRRRHSRVLPKHRASMPLRSRCSCLIRIRKCRIWGCLARKRTTSRPILQRSNSCERGRAHRLRDQTKIRFADRKQPEAQLVTPVRLAGGELQCFEQRANWRFFGLRPVHVAAIRLKALPHVDRIGFAILYGADPGERLQLVLAAERNGRRINTTTPSPGLTRFNGAALP